MSNHNYVGIEAPEIGDKAHLTLLFLGDREPGITALDIIKPYQHNRPSVKRYGLAMFGPEKNTPVVLVEINATSILWKIRNNLLAMGYTDRTGYSFNPHISLPRQETWFIPKDITLEKPYISIAGKRFYG